MTLKPSLPTVKSATQNNPFVPLPTSGRTPLTHFQISSALHHCLQIQESASRSHSKRPFASLLLAPNNTTILLTHFSLSHIRHAESELARLSSDFYSQEYLWKCTLVSTWEPCAMCAGTIYWANVGRVLYAASEEKLKGLTGSGNGENMTLSLPCREVFNRGQKDVEVIGPVPEWEDRVVKSAKPWWDEHRE